MTCPLRPALASICALCSEQTQARFCPGQTPGPLHRRGWGRPSACLGSAASSAQLSLGEPHFFCFVKLITKKCTRHCSLWTHIYQNVVWNNIWIASYAVHRVPDYDTKDTAQRHVIHSNQILQWRNLTVEHVSCKDMIPWYAICWLRNHATHPRCIVTAIGVSRHITAKHCSFTLPSCSFMLPSSRHEA